VESMRRSMSTHGQLTALAVFADRKQLEVIDGFKRVQAARELGWKELRVRESEVGVVDAKVQIAALHDRRGLTEIEEGWLVRSLYRDDRLTQGEIGQRLARHKSWVCRRLMLVEGLDPALQGDVRLGLLAPRAAVVLGQLPRGNQVAASALVSRRGLTVRQTELVVAELTACADDAARAGWIASRLEGPRLAKGAGDKPTRAMRSEADWMATDIATLRQAAGRLEVRLLTTPLLALGAPAAELLLAGLVALRPVIATLGRTLSAVTEQEVGS
jgi:ParB-like chromosome segregation protein Spo0J